VGWQGRRSRKEGDSEEGGRVEWRAKGGRRKKGGNRSGEAEKE
jgi:hypothetical protein